MHFRLAEKYLPVGRDRKKADDLICVSGSTGLLAPSLQVLFSLAHGFPRSAGVIRAGRTFLVGRQKVEQKSHCNNPSLDQDLIWPTKFVLTLSYRVILSDHYVRVKYRRGEPADNLEHTNMKA